MEAPPTASSSHSSLIVMGSLMGIVMGSPMGIVMGSLMGIVMGMPVNIGLMKVWPVGVGSQGKAVSLMDRRHPRADGRMARAVVSYIHRTSQT